MAQTSALAEKIGQLIVVGVHGTSPDQASVRKLMDQAARGLIGGTILFRYNIETPDQVRELTRALQASARPFPLFLFVDQEGGKVQRLSAEKGFEEHLSAGEVARTLSREEAVRHYRGLGRMLRTFGFNFDFAPCVDLDGDPPCPVIGGLDRSYGREADQVRRFAGAMTQGLSLEGVFNCIKHYPGHGRAAGDTHTGLVDVTETWSPEELIPFADLIRDGGIDAVMTAHVVHNQEDPGVPASFSPRWIQRLRTDLGFDGLVIPDDLHMGAILHRYSLEEMVVTGLNAGLDLLLFSNNPLAARARGIRQDKEARLPGDLAVPDEDLPEKVIAMVTRAVDQGRLPLARIEAAHARVTALKQRLVRPES